MKANKQGTAPFSERFAGTFFFASIVIHLMFLLSLSQGFLNPLFDDATHRVGQGADFYAVYQAGQNVVDGVSIYLKNSPTMVVPYSYVYRYLPFSAYTFGQVFRLFSPPTAYVVWILILEALLFLNLRLTNKMFSGIYQARIAMGVWLLFSPYYLELYMGQFSFLMATLYFWMIYYWNHKREVAGDTLWTLSLLIKTNSALFIPVLLKIKKWKSILLTLCVVTLLSLPYFVLMPGTFKEFALNFTEGLSVETIAGNQGFAALLSVFLLRLGGHWISFINLFSRNIEMMNAFVRPMLLVWTLLVFGVCLLLTFRTSRKYSTELLLLWILAYFLTYKHVWEHHYVMMLPVFVFLFHQMVRQSNGMTVSPKVFWVTFVVIAFPTPFALIDKAQVLVDPEFYWTTAESISFHLAKPFAVFTLFLVIAVSLWKFGKETIPKRSNTVSNVKAEAV